MNKDFSYKESSALEKKYIFNSFQKINKSISDANKILKNLQKIKKKTKIFKEGDKSLLSDKTYNKFLIINLFIKQRRRFIKRKYIKSRINSGYNLSYKMAKIFFELFFMKNINLYLQYMRN